MNIKPGYTFDDVLLIPKHSSITSRRTVDLSVVFGHNCKLAIPIVSANMKTVTGPKMAAVIAYNGGLPILHRFSEDPVLQLDEARAFLPEPMMPPMGISIGVHEKDKEILSHMMKHFKQPPHAICVDVAHGDHNLCIEMASWVAYNYPETLLIAGNVATGEGALRLADTGADVIKVGIGPGSLCSTRIETGNGVPQLTALEDVKTHLKSRGLNHIKIIADGGIKNAGDCVKALCFADAVMVGNLLAGTDEAPGDLILMNGKQYKSYAGSSTHKTNHVEGVVGLVPYRGPVINILTRLIEGIRSGLSYQGAKNLAELKVDPHFVSISHAGLVESRPHDIIIS